MIRYFFEFILGVRLAPSPCCKPTKTTALCTAWWPTSGADLLVYIVAELEIIPIRDEDSIVIRVFIPGVIVHGQRGMIVLQGLLMTQLNRFILMLCLIEWLYFVRMADKYIISALNAESKFLGHDVHIHHLEWRR